MAALGIIAKAVENLRSLQIQESLATDHEDKKKEKIANCMALTNGISIASVKAAPQALNLSIETLLCLCDDSDSDVRTVADECLNKIIRAIADSYVLKVQFELYREIKRNGAARCLRAALWRFGLLSHMIRPVKAKVFALQLTPCILEIAKRREDIVIDTLSQSLPLILKTLGHYIPDKDIQALLEAFFKNVTSSEAILRRASANMILVTCLNCRKPLQFMNYVIEVLTDMLSRVAEGNMEEEEGKDDRVNMILGVFACLRLILPSIDANSDLTQDFNEDHILDHHICIYELSLFYTKFYTNHNVINAALETLAQLLQNPPKNVVSALLSKDGITQRINKLKERGKQWPSRISLSTTVYSEDNLESSSNLFESDIMDIPEIAPKVEKWMTDIADVMPTVEKAPSKLDISDSSQIIDTKDIDDYSGLIIGSIENESMELESNAGSDVGRFEKPIDTSLLHCSDPKEVEEDLDDTTVSIVSTHDVSLHQFMLQRNDLAIGSLLDNDVSLHYCCRFLVSSFLLTGSPGQLIPDKHFRVSVKSLALTCVGNMLKLYPKMLYDSLKKIPRKDPQVEDRQMISDILLFFKHSDPQIRGNVLLAVGYFLQGIFLQNNGCFSKESSESSVTIENLIQLILKGLEDESATTCRQTLTALGMFLPSLLESEESKYAILVLKVLPSLVKNPYFLVKIKLLEIVSELPYTTIEHVCGELQFQENIVNVLLKLLSDQDQRVRKAAGIAITKIVPCLYSQSPHEDAVTRKASLYAERYLTCVVGGPTDPTTPFYIEHKLLINSLVSPYDVLFRSSSQDRGSRERTDEALSRILGHLVDRLLVPSTKYTAYGCCEALSLLSETFLTTIYPKAWDCFVPAGRVAVKKAVKKTAVRPDSADCCFGFTNEMLSPISNNLFCQSIILLSSSPLSLDLCMHRHLLLLAGNIASGIATTNSRQMHASNSSSSSTSSKSETETTGGDFKYWTFFKDKQSSRNMEQLLVHVMRVLNIFQHVVEDLPSPIQTVSKSSLASLSPAQSLSPKRKLLPDHQSSKSKSSSSSSGSSEHHHRLGFRFGGKEQMGSLSNNAHYLRLYELLRAAHANYRVTLDQDASELYVGLLNACLQVLSQILEVASINEAGRIAEELLSYLQSTVLLSSTYTVQCVRQLLKCLFGTNLVARWQDIYDAQAKQEKRENSGLQDEEFRKAEFEVERGFYEQCFQKPAKLMVERIKGIGSNCRGGNEPDATHRTLVTSLHRKEDRKVSSILKMLSRNSDQNSVGSFIRLFEPLVIKSLIQYTISNSVPLQCQVLMLLSQLVQLHINYCLMDSDKIFIGFVMKQFEFIEEGHIGLTEQLLPRIFDFLVRLSYEKYHSKLIIGVPKIIQLCDGLMASGQPPLTHCIPALVPVVEEMFLARNTPANVSEEKELETTREVLISMMLRLVEYPQIIELLAKCLTESRLSNDGNGEEKWRRWSRQTMDTLLPMLATRKVRVESKRAYFALVKLFSAVSPTVFRPVDPLLRVLFTMPPPVGKNLISYNVPSTSKNILEFKRWIGMVNLIIMSLISYAKEEVMLARLSDVTSSVTDLPEILLIPDSSRPISGDPLNVSGLLESFSMPPERILARFIFRVIGSMSSAFVEMFQGAKLKPLNDTNESDEDEYVIHQFTLLLQLCIHMFETGSHCKVANASMQLVKGDNIPKDERLSLNDLNEVMMEIGSSCPILTCQWTYLLTLLGFDDMSFWSRVIGYPSDNVEAEKSLGSINAKILRRASTILFCDYVCENVSSDSERLSWLLLHHIETMIGLADESPVRELVAVAVHRDPVASGLFLRAVSDNCCRNGQLIGGPSFIKKLLQCLEGAHQSQSGQLLTVLVPRLLQSKYLALSRMAAKIASRRVEVLLALGKEEAMMQLSREDFKAIMNVLKKENMTKKHGALIGLLNKLATSHYELEALELDHSKPFNPLEVKSIKLDRAWYLSQVRSRCCNPCVSYGCYESAWLLNHLNLDECLEIFSLDDFNVKLLQDCIIVGARLTAQASQQLELDRSVKPTDNSESVLYKAAKISLIGRLRSILQELPASHEIFLPIQNLNDKPKQSNYTSNLSSLLLDKAYRTSLFLLIPAVTSYISCLPKLSHSLDAVHEESFARFALLCLESAHFLLLQQMTTPRELGLSLKCASIILQDPSASSAFDSSPEHHSWVCSAAAALTEIVGHFCKSSDDDELPGIEKGCSGLQEALEAGKETKSYAIACLRMSMLVAWLEKRQKSGEEGRRQEIPSFFAKPIKSLIISVARQPLVNSFVLTPPLLWKNGCAIVGTGPTKCHFTLFLSEPNYIPELDVLEEFIFRISLLGWNSRQQFEEIWMVLLGVLNVSQLQNEMESETSTSLSHTASLAVQAIANLLVQTLLLPCPGNPNNGMPIKHTRDPQLSLHKKSTKRLFFVQDLLLWKYENSNIVSTATTVPVLEHLFNRGNLEPRTIDPHNYSYGQLSISYLWSLCSLHEDKLSSSTLSLKKRRDEALAAASLDVNSCIRFLLELYASWMSAGTKLPPRLLYEVVKSLLFVSEMFVERSQFQWMLESCLELWKVHLAEDEILRKHLIVAVCKASAVLTPLDPETLDKVKRSVDVGLKGSLSMRIATLHGILYILQSAVLANCEETMSAMHPLAIEYIQRYIDPRDSNRVTSQSEEHQCTLWALVFFLLEHAEDSPPDVEAPAVLELILSLVSSQGISTSLHRMLLQGLERLVATKSVIGKVSEQVVKISIERLRQANPALSLPALQLFLTCMYTDTADRFNQPELEEPLPDIEPEILVRSIERSAVIFDKIKKGYPMEVEILCAVLSEVLIDFFPPLEILTKVIGEFLSPQQPHPRLMSAIVFKICERACNSTQLGLLQTWVVFSIQNFIQSLPLIMSTWCLSCFFISTSTNPWLRALFPHVQSRIGKYEYEDKKILCLAASDFYSQLTNESQRETFIKTFEDAAKTPGTPFGDILASF
ncbi:huntingtin isoform X2 [Nasonia vitripennis]|uniref:Huntingtin n=1 Tax=Nasonia vitripennis TaxID=7425 RepID=A0A7M7H4F0_NASVI|nr:huntingtin isoform X2 [Nasonia vitripennis]